jgi:hypothetical protein
VKDATGAVIPGSSLTLLNTVTGVTHATTSNGDRIFNFPVVSISSAAKRAMGLALVCRRTFTLTLLLLVRFL